MRDYYRNITAHSDEEDYLDESNVNNDWSREINEHSTVEREQTSKKKQDRDQKLDQNQKEEIRLIMLLKVQE